MKDFQEFLSQIQYEIERLSSLGCDDPFFRGHSNASWDLIPGIARESTYNKVTENRLYHKFISHGAHLFHKGVSSWEVLFMMQHYGLPTRLLDWTENFAVALWFALFNPSRKSTIWILDPYRLNEYSLGRSTIEYLDQDYPSGYESYFIDDHNTNYNKFPSSVIAVAGSARFSRIRDQRGVFTLHNALDKPLDVLFPEFVRRFDISSIAHSECRAFLRLSGITEFTLFSDLDGLSRYLKSTEL